MNSRPVFFRISRNRKNAASAPSMRPKALSGSIAKYSRGLALSVLTLIGASQAPGANYYWDANGGTAGTGGTGTWDTGTSLWRDGSDTGTLGVWPNATTDGAVFGGTAGTVTLNTAINANSLTFNTSGYLLTGSGSRILTLSGTTPTISVGSGLTATINTSSATNANSVILAGTTGLTKTGDGTLLLRWSNAGAADNNTFVPHTFTGGVVVNGGTLRTEIVSSSTAKSNFINSANSLTLSRGTYSQNTSGDNWFLTQTFNGLTVNAGANAINLNISGGTSDNDLSIGAITRSASLGGTITFSALDAKNSIGNTTGNTNVNGILGPWAFWESSTGTRYATNTGATTASTPGSQFVLGGLGGTSANNANDFTLATENYGFTTTVTTILSTNRTANTVRYGTNSGNTIDTNGNTLTLNGILNSGIGALTISGTGSVVIGTTNQLVIHPSNTLTAISPIVISTPITGSAGATLVKAGPGNLTLSGVNTYDGGTFLNAGTLTLGSTTALTTALGTGTLTINGGALDSSVANLANTTNNNVQNWNGDFTFVGTNSLNLGTGAVTMNASRTVAVNANTLTVGGAIGGSGFGLTKTGNGTLALSGANTYDGATTINGGTLQVGNATAGSLNGTTGTALTFGGTGSFIVSEASGVSQGMGALAFNAGRGNVTSTNNGGNSFLTFASLAARPVGVTGNFTTTNGSNGTTNKIVLTDATNAPLGGSGANNQGFFFGGTEYARYDAGGYFRATDYTAVTDTNASSVAGGASIGSVTSASDVKITGAITTQTAAVVNTINMGAFNITMSGASPVLQANGLLASGGTNVTLGGGTTPRLQPTSSGGEIVIRVAGSSDQLTVSSIIQNNTTASPLTKTGAGTLVLSGTNTYTGKTYVNEGTLTISNVANLGASPTTGGTVTVLTSATNSKTVTISSVPAGFVVGSTLLGSDVVNINGTTVTLYNFANEAIVSSTSRSFFDNNNTLNLNGATLRTTANVGLFSGNTAAGTNNRSIVFSNGVTFNTDANTVLTVAGGITGSGGLTKSGLGTLTLTNGNTSGYNFTGGITVNGGTLSISPTNHAIANAKTDIVNTTNAVSLNNATLQWGAQTNQEGIDQTFNGVTISGPTVFNGQNNGGNNSTQILRLNYITRNAGATASFTLASTASIFTTTANTNSILGPWATIGTGSSTRYATGATTTGTSTTITGLTGTTAADATAFASATTNYEFTTGSTTTLTGPSTAYTARYSGTVGNTIDLGSSGSNTLTLNGLLNAGTGTLTIQRSGSSTGTVVIGNTNELIVNTANAAVAISAPITNNGVTAGALIKTGSNRLTLSGDNTYTGGTYLNAGVLALGSTTALGTVAGTLRINGGALDSTVANLVNANNNVQTWNGNFTFVGTNSLNLGTGAVTLTDNRTVAVTANTLTVGGIIGDGGSGFGLTKSGFGTLVLNGVNTFSGATSVTQGAVGGTGTIAGAVTVSSTGGINLLRDGAVGTLTLGSTLAITGASGANNLYFDLASAGSTTDKIAVTGAFSMTTSGAGVVNVNQLGGVGNRLTAGTYDIITAASGLSAANFQLATTKAFGQTFGLTNPDAQTLRLTTAQVTSATPTAFWAGTTDVNWSSSTNWRTTVAGGVAVAGAPDYQTDVTFATTTPGAAQLLTNVLDVDFDINSLTFNSGLTAITIGGTTKTLTLEAAAGAGITSTQTTVTNTISAKVGLAASQTWSVAGTTAALGGLTVSGVISDFGAGYGLTKAGAGTLTLSGANTFTGGVSITGGTLSVNSLPNGGVASPLGMSGGAASNLLLGNGTTLTYTGTGGSTDRSFTINGTAAGHGATLDASGTTAAINFTNTASPAYGTADQTRTLTLTGNSTQTNTLAANIADNGTGAVSVAKTGSGTWVLSGNSSFTGGLTLSGGIVIVTSDANLGAASGPITFTSNSTLQLGSSGVVANVSSSRQINLNSNTATFITNDLGAGSSFSTSGKVTGTGNILVRAVSNAVTFNVSLNSTSNDFTGSVTIDGAANGGSSITTLSVASLVDAPGNGNIRFGRTNTAIATTQQFTYTGASALTLNNRQIEFILDGSSNSVLSSSQAAINVNTDLLFNPAFTGAKSLTLSAPANVTSTFSGKIVNGPGATPAFTIFKSGPGTWNLTNALNTYTGGTTVSAGTLGFVSGALGTTGTINASGGTLLWLSGNTQDVSSRLAMTAATTTTLDTGANSVSFASAIGSANTGALTKNGIGTLTLAVASTYTGTTTVNLGTLAGTQTSGTPFGTGAVTLNAGTLSLAPTGSGSNVTVTGGTVAAATKFTFNAGATLSLNKGSQTSLTYTFGTSGATWTRGITVGNTGTLILSVGAIANLGAAAGIGERFLINGTAPTTVGTALLVDGVVAQDRGNSNVGEFVTYGAINGFAAATPTLLNTFTGSVNTSYVNVTSPTSTGTIAAHAVKVSGTTLTNSGTLTLGNGANTAGLILNSGIVSGGTLTTPAAAAEFVIYTSGTSEISSVIPTAAGMIGMSVFGPGTLALTSSSANGFTGGLRINNTTVIATNDNQLGGTTSQINLVGGTLQTSGPFGLGQATGQRSIVLAAGQDQTGGTFNVTSDVTTFTSTTSKVISGSGSLTKTGAGILALATSTPTTNTYTGGTFVNVGTLRLDASSMLADTGAMTVGGGIFDIQGNSDTVGAVTLTSGSINGSGGTLTGTSYAVQGGTASANLAGTGAAMTKTTSGTVSLSGTNTYTGNTLVSVGTLQFAKQVSLYNNGGAAPWSKTNINVNSGATMAFNIGGSGEFTNANIVSLLGLADATTNGFKTGAILGLDTTSGDVLFNSVIANPNGGANVLGLTKLGTNKLTLDQANTYTGVTTVSNGTLKLNRTAADNTTILTDNNTATTSDIVINGGTLELAASEQISNTGSINMTSGAFNFGAATGRTETIDKFTNSGGTFSTGANTLIGLGATVTWSGTSINTVSNGGNVQDAHIVISGGTNTVEGGVTGGVLQLNASGTGLEMSNGATLTLNADAAFAGKLLLSGNISTIGDATVTIASAGVGNPGNIDLNNGTRTFTVADGTAPTDMSISARITNTGSIIKDGAGTLSLGASNDYVGTTTINNGTLIANALGALPLSSRTAVSFGGGGGTLTLGSSFGQSAASLSSAGAATVALGSSTLTVGIAGGPDTTFAGSITGAGSLFKDENSKQVLSGNNDYTGTTTVSAGTLEVTGSLSGTTAVTVSTGGTLLMNSAASNIVNTTATVAMAGGTLAFGNAANQTQNLGAMTLTANSILDFGASGGNDKFHFAGFSHPGGTLTGGTLTINNWLGNDAGGTDGLHDRLVFTGLFTDFTSSFTQSQISFNGTSGYAAIDFGGTSYEIVPVPEPATTALIGSIALCALVGYRERRRFTGLGKRMAARK